MSASALPNSVDAMLELLTSRAYLAERSLATLTYLSLRMGPPLFTQGEAGEAYLLEILADFQVTIPEFGTVKAPQPPIVIITSNRTREIHDALKRRCLYHWVDYPNAERELAIVKSRVPDISAKLSQQVVRFA